MADGRVRRRREFLEDNTDWNDETGPPTDEDAWEDLAQDCGRTPQGGCTRAGSEYCDWECPFSDDDEEE